MKRLDYYHITIYSWLCSRCGLNPLWKSLDARVYKPAVLVNLHCQDGVYVVINLYFLESLRGKLVCSS